MKEIDLLAGYVDYKIADGCLNWVEFKTLKQKQNIVKEFDKYILLKEHFEKMAKKLDAIESALYCMTEDISYTRSLLKDVKEEMNEVKNE